MVDQGLFICPRCASPVRPEGGLWNCGDASCRYAEEPFPVVAGIPALVDFEHSVLDADRLRAVEGASEIHRSKFNRVAQRLTYPRNATAPAAVARMLELLRFDDATPSPRPRILVIGGGAVGAGLEELYAHPTVDLVAFDIYRSPVVQFIADGHAIPLTDASVDGVVVQAVLEHVLEPTVVAQEIHRVLRSGGIVYADTPFIQQVHEGPYDFTRFTDSGHRYLFRSFERIDSGSVAGVGTALRWSLNFFVRALTRSVRLGNVMALCFFWLSYVDRILDPKHSLDGASSVFFLGRKTDKSITEAEIIDYYQGGWSGRARVAR
jgi:SAM-dependent methyltransferase